MQNSSPEGRFMVAVGAIVENVETGKILILKRTEKADFACGAWEYILGRMKNFEDPREALKREVNEEAGIEIEVVKPISVFHIFRGEKTADKEVVGITFWCKTKSEKVTISREHTDFKWVAPLEALKFIKYSGIEKDIELFINEKKQQVII